jgi:hypothetical protein
MKFAFFLTQHFFLTDNDKAERVPGGTQSKFDNRIYSISLTRKLIENTKRPNFKLWLSSVSNVNTASKKITNFTIMITREELKKEVDKLPDALFGRIL